jgi:hypothetical protein
MKIHIDKISIIFDTTRTVSDIVAKEMQYNNFLLLFSFNQLVDGFDEFIEVHIIV